MVLACDKPVAHGEVDASKSELDFFDPNARADWNDVCAGHPESTFFHTTHWLRLLSHTYGFRPLGFISGGKNQTGALIPFLETTSVLGKKHGTCLPFTDLCEPLFWDEAEASRTWQRLTQMARERSWQTLEWRGGRTLNPQASPSLTFYGHRLNINPKIEETFQSFDPSVRRGIRKAEREGVSAVVSVGFDAVLSYYKLHCATRRRHGVPPQPISLFRNIYEYVIRAGLGFVVIAVKDSVPVGGAVFFRFGDKAVFKFGASAWEHRDLRPNHLVMWEAIKFLAHGECSRLHLGRTSLANEGLRRFKLSWGATEEVIEYFRFSLGKMSFLKDHDRALGWPAQLFRWAPLWLSRVAGSLLYGRFVQR